MNTYHVTYYYCATGMEGRADTIDYGYISANSADEAKSIVAARDYRPCRWEHDWVKSCLTAKLILSDSEAIMDI